MFSGEDNIGKVLNCMFAYRPGDEEFHWKTIASHIELESAMRLIKLVRQIEKNAEDEFEAAKAEHRTPIPKTRYVDDRWGVGSLLSQKDAADRWGVDLVADRPQIQDENGRWDPVFDGAGFLGYVKVSD